MRILSHRGFWDTPAEHNTSGAFARSFSAGFGVETDLRDRLGELVIAHDPATTTSLPAAEFVALHQELSPDTPLALNIKADGLATLVATALKDSPADFFCFDMSGPETRRYLQAGLPVFTRQSDIEKEPLFLPEAAGVWLDAFTSDWITRETLTSHLEAGRRVCVVSPELHRRDPAPLWSRLRAIPEMSSPEVMLCTDFPDRARQYFSAS